MDRYLRKIFMLVLAIAMPCFAQQTIAPFKTSQANTDFFVMMGAGSPYTTIQKAVTAACAYAGGGTVVILPGANPTDSITAATGCNLVGIIDRRALPMQTYQWLAGVYTNVSPGGGASGTLAFPGIIFGTSINTSRLAAATDIGALYACGTVKALQSDGTCGAYLPLSGGTLTGPLTVGGTGVVGVNVSNQQYINVEAPQFGCVGDGSADDRVCVQTAINLAASTGINHVLISASHRIRSAGGTFPLPSDDGSCPSGATVGGAACTALGPETVNMQAYGLWIPGGMELECSIKGQILGTDDGVPTLTNPVTMLWTDSLTVTYAGTPQYSGSNGVKLKNCFVGAGAVDILAPGTLSFAEFTGNEFGFESIVLIAQTWDRSLAYNNRFAASYSGFTIGGWWVQRGNQGSNVPGGYVEQGGYADGLNFNYAVFNQFGSFLVNGPATDNYFDTYFFKTANNTNGRLVDVPGTSSPTGPGSLPATHPYRGIFGRVITTYGRYSRPSNGDTIANIGAEVPAREVVYIDNTVNQLSIYNIGAEDGGACAFSSSVGTGDPINCPDPWGTGTYPAGTVNIAGGSQGANISSIASGEFYLNTVAGNGVEEMTLSNNQTSVTGYVPQNHLYLQSITGATISFSPPGPYANLCGQGWANAEAGPREDCWLEQTQAGIGEGGGSKFTISHPAGNITGPFTLNFPAVQLASQAAPTCSASTAGWIAYTQVGSGSSDTAQICYKNAANTYAYQSLLLGGPVTHGLATLIAGTATVTTTAAIAIGASHGYQLTPCIPGGTQGFVSAGTVIAGTSFIINSSNALDTSQVCWTIY